ncbi:MAG TPA: ABC transporter substrate-binding protein [Dermatophilaceae bacterium]|nr:ABC transporter substrate-binding protein [Dermatophilaceae bacterium]
MNHPSRRPILRRTHRLAVAAVLSLASVALAGCGSDSLSANSGGSTSTGAGTTSSAVPATADPALVAKLPAKIKSAGKIVIGTDATYAPNEFLDTDGKTVVGMDVDIFAAVAQQFGVTVEWQPSAFDAIILGVKSGKYDLGISSFTVNADRKKEVNMVSYFNAGTQWAVAKGNPKKVDPQNACGANVAVQRGTVQLDDLSARSKKCTAAGKPAINAIVEQGQDKVTADVVSGKADAMLADSPVGLYAVQQTGGQLEALGAVYDAAPYGIVVPKDQTDFAQAIADALKKTAASGVYQAALAKWNNSSGATTDFAVNP